jgi:hypothetical protein
MMSSGSAPKAKYHLPEISDDDRVSMIEHDTKLAGLIGEMTGRWALIEQQLVAVTAAIISNYHAADVIIYSLGSFKARIDVVRNLSQELVPEGPEKDELLWLLSKIQKASEQRNGFVHALWLLEPISKKLSRTVRRPGSKSPQFSLDVDFGELKRHSNKIAQYMARLSELTHPMPQLLRKRAQS